MRESIRATRRRRQQARGRFHVIVLDEADEATERAQVQLLSRLDSAATLRPAFGGGVSQGTPPPIIWIFRAHACASS